VDNEQLPLVKLASIPIDVSRQNLAWWEAAL
jgi:hypothetical protein